MRGDPGCPEWTAGYRMCFPLFAFAFSLQIGRVVESHAGKTYGHLAYQETKVKSDQD